MIRFGDGKPSEVAEKAAEMFYERLEYKGLIQDQVNQQWIELMISAALIHDLFSSDEFISVFYPRQHLESLADEFGIPTQAQNVIFEAIEGQLGYKTKVPKVRPTPGSPNDELEFCIWAVKRFLTQ